MSSSAKRADRPGASTCAVSSRRRPEGPEHVNAGEEERVPRFTKRSSSGDPSDEQSERRAAEEAGGAPTITGELNDGPLAGRSIEVEVVEGRPPKTIDVAAADGGTCRYCLAQWEQAGGSAAYTFLYRV
jgi:hypothetical protein